MIPGDTKSTYNPNKLAGQHVLIIGGTSGLGYALASALLALDAHVTISSSSQSRIDSTCKTLQSMYPSSSGTIAGSVCDMGTESTLESNISNLFKALTGANTRPLNHVVYTAGDRLGVMPSSEWTLDKIKQAGMVRFFAPLLVSKHAALHLPKTHQSSFTITSGAVADAPHTNWVLVAGYAGGLYSMTRNLALDMKPVRVNCISPGGVDTGLWDHMSEAEKKKALAKMSESTTTGQVGQVDDVVEAYLYVLRDGNLAGSVLGTNGGGLVME